VPLHQVLLNDGVLSYASALARSRKADNLWLECSRM